MNKKSEKIDSLFKWNIECMSIIHAFGVMPQILKHCEIDLKYLV